MASARPFKLTIEYGARYPRHGCPVVPMVKAFADPLKADNQFLIWTALMQDQGFEVREVDASGSKVRTVLAYDMVKCPLSPALILSLDFRPGKV